MLNLISTRYCDNHDPDLVQSFLEKWWVESDFKAQNLGSAENTDYWADATLAD
jgi:hypothetical protein